MWHRTLGLWITLAGLPAQGVDELGHIGPGTTSFTRRVTAQGARILTIPDAGDGRFRMNALVGAGSRHDPDDQPGMARKVADCLLLADAAATRLAGSDARFAITVDADHTIVRIESAPRHWRAAVAWLGAALTGPRFDESPSAIPAGALRRFHRERYASRNVLIAFSGRVPVAACVAALASGLLGLREGAVERDPSSRNRRTGTANHPEFGAEDRPARAAVDYYLPVATAADLVHQRILGEVVARRLAAALTVPADVAIRHDRGAHRLAIAVATPEPDALEASVARIHETVTGVPQVTEAELEQARRTARDALSVSDLESLGAVTRACWHFEAVGGASDQLRPMLDRTLLASTRAYAERFLVRSNSLTLLSTRGLRTYLIPGLVGALLLLLLIDRYRGFPIAHSVALFLRLQRAKAQAAMDEEAVVPMSGNELAERIQEYYAEEDRKPG